MSSPSQSMSAIPPPDRSPAPELRSGMGLPLAVGIAFCIEAGLIAATLHVPERVPAPPVPSPPKIVRIVTIADEPGAPEPAPPVPKPQPAPPRPAPHPPRPLPRPAPVPSPTPIAQRAAPSAAPSPTPAAEAPVPAVPAAAQPAQSAQSAPREAPKDKHAGSVRRGLVPLSRVEPEYPPRALADNIEGVVVVHASIAADGSVTAVNVVSAEPAKIFDQAAIRAVMRWRFSPNDGGVVGEIELRFSLGD